MKDTRRKETRAMTKHMTGTREEWLSARLELLKAGRGSELTIDNSVAGAVGTIRLVDPTFAKAAAWQGALVES